jgi:AcrR family transcriptional regulator
MPPIADKHLEERILKAARRLWRTRGENGLTLRAVAHEAGTTTPTLYKRFRNREALRLALAYRIREELLAQLFRSPNLETVYRRYLSYAEENPHEYDLLRLSGGQLFSPGGPRPGREWLLTQLATRFGGKPETYAPVFDTLFLFCHGTATLLIVADAKEMRDALKASCIENCDRLLSNVDIFLQPGSVRRRKSKNLETSPRT